MITWDGFISSFVTLFVILDPFVSIPVFIALMRKAKPEQYKKSAFVASSVALGLILLFLFLGPALFSVLGIDFGSFKIAGGLILLILGIQQVLGIEFHKPHESLQTSAVIIGTPLLAGPGTLSSVIILSSKYGFIAPLIASVAVCIITYFMLANSSRIKAFVGDQILEISSRVLGLLLAAIAVGFIRDGITLILQNS